MELSRREARHPRARAPGRRRRVLHAHRGRPPGATGSRSSRTRSRACWRRCAPRSRTGSRCASACRRWSTSRRRAGVDAAEVEEARALLAWVARPPLHVPRLPRVRRSTARRCAPSRAPGSGCCAAASGHVSTAFAKLPPAVRALALRADPLVLTKANTRSPIHRPALPRLHRRQALRRRGQRRRRAALPRPLHDGSPTARCRPTSRCCAARSQAVRRARRVPARQPRRQGARSRSSTRSRATSCSRSSADELYEIARGILELGERQRVRLFMRTDRYERFVSCLVFLPRDRFNTANRIKIGEILREALGAESVDWGLRLTEWVLVRIHYTLRVRAGRAAGLSTRRELEARIVEATRAWDDELHDALTRGGRRGERHGAATAATASALPGRLPRRPARALGDRRRAADRGARGRGRARPLALPAAGGARPACCAASSTGAASACRSPTCCRCSSRSG